MEFISYKHDKVIMAVDDSNPRKRKAERFQEIIKQSVNTNRLSGESLVSRVSAKKGVKYYEGESFPTPKKQVYFGIFGSDL